MRRVIAFIYGALCYVLFLATFLYLIGFVGGFVVPKSVDSAPSGGIPAALGINLLLVALFGVQHGVMARPAFKRLWTRIVPWPVERSTFVLATCAVLWLLYWQWRPLVGVCWQVDSTVGKVILHVLFWFGWALALLSTFQINHFDLFGLRQVFLHARGKRYAALGFRSPLLYRFVRHPLMLGFLIAFWATPRMTAGHAVFASAITIYLFMGIPLEERNLVGLYGARYVRYRREVPALLPLPKPRPRVDRAPAQDSA